MSVRMTGFGATSWHTDRSGYRYEDLHPVTGRPRPPIPEVLIDLWRRFAPAAPLPDACLANWYGPGAKMGLHQDKDEADFAAPIVSVSLGLPATFLWGGAKRNDKPRRIRLESGDVVVWGGPARLNFHGVDTLAEGDGDRRYNLTFRKAK
jgi:alkylated DNA repair protein (DNA oxidative demethylase)